MKITTFHNRIESREFVLTTQDIHAAILEFVEKRMGRLQPPANARQEIEFDLDGDCHAEAAKVTQRFVYDAEHPADDAVARGVEIITD